MADKQQTIRVARGGSEYARVVVHGRLGPAALGELRDRLGALVGGGACYLTVDLSEVSSCDGRIFDVLGWAECRAAQGKGWLVLTGLTHMQRFTQGPDVGSP